MTLAHGAHLVGSLAAPTTRDAMTTTATILGDRLERLSDGETGERSQWIWWQINRLTTVPGIRLGEPQVNPETGNPDYSIFPGLEVDAGVTIPDGTLGYGATALESYREFRDLRASGVIPAGVRFQVSLPTPYAVVIAWSKPGSQSRLWAPYQKALEYEVRTIVDGIPGEDLAIQWDVAVEVGVLEGVFQPEPEFSTYERIVDELVACADLVPAPAQVGLHLCYGDYKHRHFVAPTDLSLLVRIANDVAARHPLAFIHMPVDRDNGREASYFAPLRDLAIGDASLALGVIDYENDSARIDQLVAAADTAGVPYAVATECGMGRVGERGESLTLADLLQQHARVAAPIR
jgi:methionine synthase II (cobalamin-independent)